MTRPLGCLTGAGLLAGLLTAVTIGAAAAFGGNALFSPGELNAVPGDAPLGGIDSHAELARECGACHAPFWGDDRMGDRCLDCHQEVAAELAVVSGFHYGSASAGNCRDCHTEHRGADAAVTLQEIANYPHDRSGFALTAHPPTAAGGAFRCMDCHPARLLQFSVDSCQGCHRMVDPGYTRQHAADFGLACLDCHDGVDRFGSHFDHQMLVFALDGAHADVRCSACHPGARTVSALQSAPTLCIECHQPDDVHAGRLGRACESCHTPQTWKGAELDHRLIGFPLEGAHAEADCLGCHVERQWSGVPRDCQGCHSEQNEHSGQFAQDCSACHQPTDWDDVTFDHNLSRFPLTGSHRSNACLRCHEGGSFAGTPTACSACHAEPGIHRGVFGTQCASCHSTSAWLPATWNGSHSFPMNHGKAGGNCSTCHPSSYGQYTCYNCHKRSEIEKKHREEVGGNFSDCTRCHPNGDKEEGEDGDDE